MMFVLLFAITACSGEENKEQEKESVKNEIEQPEQTVAGEVTSGPVKTEEPVITVEPTEEPEVTEAPAEEPEFTAKPTIEPTKTPMVTTKPTLKPTVKPTKAPTKAPVVTKAPTKKPVVTKTPTKAPTKTPAPTKEPAKTYWYSWVIPPAEFIEQSELPPDKYPLPDGFAKWTGPEYSDFYDAYIWIAELKDNELAYNADGTPNLKEAMVYCADEEFVKYILESKEFKAYFEKKGITNVICFEAWLLLESRRPNAYEYCYKNGDDPNGDFIYIYLDKNYKVVEENPYD